MHYNKRLCAEYHKLWQNLQLDNGDNDEENVTSHLKISRNPFINFYRSYELTHPSQTIMSLASHVAKLWAKMNMHEKKRFTHKAIMKLRLKQDNNQSRPPLLDTCSLPYGKTEFSTKETSSDMQMSTNSAPPEIENLSKNPIQAGILESCVQQGDQQNQFFIKPELCADTLCNLNTDECFQQCDPLTYDAAMQVAFATPEHSRNSVTMKDNWNQPSKISLSHFTKPKRKEETISCSNSPNSSVEFIGVIRGPSFNLNDSSTDEEEEYQPEGTSSGRTIYKRIAKTNAMKFQKNIIHKPNTSPIKNSRNLKRKRSSESSGVQRKRRYEYNGSKSPNTNTAKRRHTKDTSDVVRKNTRTMNKTKHPIDRHISRRSHLGGRSYRDIIAQLGKDIRALKEQRRMYDNLSKLYDDSDRTKQKKKPSHDRNQKRRNRN